MKPQPRRPWCAALASIRSAKPQTVLPCTAALALIQSASRAALLLVVLPLAGCSEGGGKPPPVVVGTAPARVTDAGQLARGAKIYKANCAVCHGGQAQGATNWQKPGPDGKYPPPPLDGSAHAWHHPYTQLKLIIQEGTLKLGGSMPAWKGKLTEADTEVVIAHFQSLWPEEIYRAWQDIDRRARIEAAK